ncbi:nitroreductase family protein [Streptomyces sp. NBC_01102]|uniref:nitroreductase family protein n=1 Tax=Streptomyces sp. NBC_01102 TaxID=2903749 RepID=UPI00386F3ADE|nr:nitroreductase family protein [Streptomyces sp. NBC_01102]
MIEECLTLATQAPTGRNRQHWDFVFVTDPDRRAALADLYRMGLVRPRQPLAGGINRGDADGWDKIANSAQHLFEHLHEVPVPFVPCVRVTDRQELQYPVRSANIYGSILPAVRQFMLAARSRGLGTAWTTPHLHYEREAAELLGIPYDTVIQTALIPVAYTIGTDFKPGARVPAAEVAQWDQW